MGRIASIDYGRARIGLAISDERKIIALPLITIPAGDNKKIHEELSKRGTLDALVIGLPLMLNGKEGEMAIEVRSFAEKLKEFFSIPILFWDERLTTAMGDRLMKDADLNRKQRSQKIDTLSATLILQNYLDAKSCSC